MYMTLKMNLEGILLGILTTFPEKYFVCLFCLQQLSAKNLDLLELVLFSGSWKY